MSLTCYNSVGLCFYSFWWLNKSLTPFIFFAWELEWFHHCCEWFSREEDFEIPWYERSNLVWRIHIRELAPNRDQFWTPRIKVGQYWSSQQIEANQIQKHKHSTLELWHTKHLKIDCRVQKKKPDKYEEK